MDPFLEQDWLDVHSALVTYIRDQLQERLPGELCARMESRVLVEDAEEEEMHSRHPDVRVVESDRGSSGGGGTAVLEETAVAVAEPDLVLIAARSEPATERYIEIVDSQTRKRVITTIELIRPTNKRPGPGQNLYLAKRDECLQAKVNVVEIDLTRNGDRLSILPELASVHPAPTYVGCVRRAVRPFETAVYLLPLDRPLKPMRIPLRPTDPDAILELQPLVAQAYRFGRYDRLDYSRPLNPPATAEEAAIIGQLLKGRQTASSEERAG
jgi:hypothetical protein